METVSPSIAGTDAADVGARLREARERRAITLDELARITKIRQSVLGALEMNRRDALPTTIFLRGFVYAYAREVGLDGEETSRAYLDQFRLTDVPAEDSAASAETAAPHIDRPAGWTRFRTVAITVAVAAVVFAYSLAHRGKPAPAPPLEVAAAPAQSGPAAGGGEVGTSGSSTPAAVPAAGRALQVGLEATAVCWVSANVDGARVAYQLLQPGERRSFTVNDVMALRVGEPSALNLTIDGVAARPLGTAGHATTVRITPENFREFVR